MTNSEKTPDDDDGATPQLDSDIDDPGGKLPTGGAEDRRGPEPPDEELLAPAE